MDDACVGHTAYLYDRGGITRVGEFGPLISVQWHRVRDDISTAQIVMPNPDCSQIVSQVEAGRSEMVIYRGSDRVWEGPITLVTYERDQTTVEARDVVHYLERLIMRSAYDNSFGGTKVTGVGRLKAIITGELTRLEAQNPPVNVAPFLHFMDNPGDAGTSRSTTAFQKTVFEELDDMAAKGGLDYVTVGRSLYVYDTDNLLGRTATITEADILGDVIVTQYGMNLATFSAVTGADGQYGSAGGPDPYYGLVEVLTSSYDEDTGGTAPSLQDLADQAQRNLSGRNPTPTTVRIPDGSTLNPASPITVGDLVPGVEVPLLATMTGRTFSQMQKLDQMVVNETSDGETVQITLVPATSDAYLGNEEDT